MEFKKFRRRLAGYDALMDTWLKNDPESQRLAFRPFGGWNYSYTKSEWRTGSFSAWLVATVATLGVDWREAAIVLGGSVLAQETVKKEQLKLFIKDEKDSWVGMGASWVFNVQLGYLVYHILFKGNKRWLVWLASGYVGVGNIYGLSQENVANYQHAEGFVVGIVAAFLLDFVFKKREALV